MGSEWMTHDGMSLNDITAKVKAEAMAAEDTAVYNLDLIHKLERRADGLESDSVAQAKRITDLQACIGLNKYRDEAIQERVRRLEREIEETFRPGCADLENALADARRDHADLVKLVGRMGRDLDSHCMTGFAREYRYPYTTIGQREYDAAMHEAEGAPPDARMLESMQ